ncbi:hypothetical protein [Nonomuraea endophytica]|uniref:hypothetical protein n=1 Tax=Nonomuraea endophytica TaxID=714136 RepID=UPI0037CBF8A7
MDHLARRRRLAAPGLALVLTFTLTPAFTAPAQAAPARAVLTQILDDETPPPGDTGPEGEPWAGDEPEVYIGVDGSDPRVAGADVVCRGANGAIACFEKRGDVMWIVKTTPMSWAKAKAWVYAWDRVKWRYIKRIECHAGPGIAVGQWKRCTRDIWEDNTLNPWGGRGSGVRLRPATSFGESSLYSWVRNDG